MDEDIGLGKQDEAVEMTSWRNLAAGTVAAEAALAAVTVAAVVSLARIFEPGAWLVVLAAHAVVAHAVAAATRRADWTAAGSVLAVVGVGAAVTVAVHGDFSPAQVVRNVNDSFAGFDDVKAPIAAEDGYLAVCTATVWVIAALADWWAFRLRAVVESVVPAGALFVVGAILGADRGRAMFAGGFVATVLVHVLVSKTATAARRAQWIGGSATRGPSTMIRLGVVLVLSATLFAVVVGPRLPTATAEGVVDLRDLDGSSPGPREVRPPIVDVKRQQVELSDVVMFQVRSDRDVYWRLTSLERFDGRRWESSGSFGKADGDLDDGVPVDAERTILDQEFRILGLGQVWAPAAYEPVAARSDADLRYDESSGTLIVGNELATSDGIVYEVTSALPILEPAQLASASSAVPERIAEVNLGLPTEFPAEIAALAEQVTQGADSNYGRALLLQSFFRSEFEYSLDVQDSHSTGTMMNFLFENRVGYCEQFAATFAAMARSLGIPARVAVGFTPGERATGDPGVLNVRGVNAHAWPEVFLGEYGWVAFEPTPGRGNPTAEAYTGVPAQQEQRAESPEVTVTVPTSVVPAELTTPTTTATEGVAPDDSPGDGVEGQNDSHNPWPARIALAAAALATTIGIYVLVVWAFDRWRARARRAAATTDTERVATAWDEALAAVADAGVTTRIVETQAETAGRVNAGLPAAADDFGALAAVVERTTFSDRPVPEGTGLRAYELADSVRVHADATRDLRTRLRDKYHPLVRLRRSRR